MPRDGSGNYIPPSSSWSPAQNGSAATPDDWNQLLTDIATALTQSLPRDGQAPMTGELQMGNSKLTGLAKGTNPTDAANLQNIYDRTGQAGAVGFRNRIINGNFSVNQRAVAGPVVLAAGAYGHDRWKAGPSGCTYTVAPGAPNTAITITVGTLQQIIEFNMLEGGQMVLSWDGSAQARVGSSAYSASPLVATVPAGTALAIEFSTGSIGKVQFEMGSVPTAFELRPPSIELSLCQRYFQVVAVGFNGSAASIGITYGGTVTIPAMRTVPFCSWLTDNEVNNFPVGSLNLTPITPYWVKFSKAASGIGPAYYSSSFTADAEI